MNILAILVKAINVLRWQSYKKYDEWDREYCVKFLFAISKILVHVPQLCINARIFINHGRMFCILYVHLSITKL